MKSAHASLIVKVQEFVVIIHLASMILLKTRPEMKRVSWMAVMMAWSKEDTGNFRYPFLPLELGGCGFGRDTCSGVEYCTLSAAVFVSVNYPFPYAPNSQCRWNIVTPEGSFVTITFTLFDVVSDTNDQECTQTDYLIAYDGVSDEDSQPSVLGRFCNANPPSNDVRSSLNVVVIEFVSDDDLEGGGFYAEYRATYTELDVDSTAGGTEAEYTCPEGWELFGSKCFQFTSLNRTIRWNDASKMCRDIGAFLVSITTAKEMNFIHYMLTSSWFTGNSMNTYIGNTDFNEIATILENQLKDNFNNNFRTKL
eukprot:XP_011665640.1 PREDICTED: embryonic protein UVS.2-like [Strongylocentrotus purpuratus]